MPKKLPLCLKITSAVLLIVLSQINTNLAQQPPSDEMTFTAISPITFDVPIMLGEGFPASSKGFVLIASEGETCVNEQKETELVTKSVNYLFLDEEQLDSTFTVNQKARNGNIRLRGTMRHLEAEAFDKDCNPTRIIESTGTGGLDLNFNTQSHSTPRNFLVTTAAGKIFGPKLNAALQMPSSGTPFKDQAQSFDTSFLKDIIPNRTKIDPKLLEKYGVKLPPDVQELLKQNQNTSSESKFSGIINSSQTISGTHLTAPKVIVHFMLTSGFEADMLVYKPEALASGGGAATAGFNKTPYRNTLSNRGFIRNANFSVWDDRFFSADYARNSSTSGRKQISGQILIPKYNHDKVQAFVNLDNDDRDDKFDNLRDEVVEGGDNDLIKIVLRVKVAKKATKATAQLYVEKGRDKIRIWRKDDKSEEFTPRDQLNPMAVNQTNFPETYENSVTGDLILKKTLWIEGIKPSDQREVLLKFLYSDTGNIKAPNKTQEARITILGIESIEWEGQRNSIDSDDDLNKISNKDPNHRLPGDPEPGWKQVAAGKCFEANENSGQTPTTRYTPGLKPEAVRVFPGKRRITGGLTEVRNKVWVKVKLTVAPVAPVNVYFKSFDVDDPMLSSKGDDESAQEDNRGEPKTGTFDDKVVGIFKKEFSGQEEKFEFKVTMQPGDNFRIVGSSDESFLENLHNDDQKLNIGSEKEKAFNKQRIVDSSVFDKTEDPERSEILQPDNYASKVLTVWRFFYAEVDYMDKVLKESIEGTIKSVQRDSPVKGQTTITINERIAEQYSRVTDISSFSGESTKQLSDKTGVRNAFNEGTITIATKDYKVISSSNNRWQSDTIVVDGILRQGIDQGREFSMVADDKEMGFPRGTDLKNLNNPDVQPIESDSNQAFCIAALRYQDAYIVPDFTILSSDEFNKNKTVPFRRNIDSKNDVYNFSYFKFDNFDYHQDDDFWAVYVLFAFKGATYEDGDPDGQFFKFDAAGNTIKHPPPNQTASVIYEIDDPEVEFAINGIADDKNGTGVYVFMEGCSERNMGSLYDFTGNGIGVKDALIHEIGHLFGAGHLDEGLMGFPPTSLKFTEDSLLKIRSTKHP